jgi:hypothetical protein
VISGITKLSIKDLLVTPSINDSQHKQDSVLQKSVSSVAMLIITFGFVMLDVIMLNVVLLIVVVPMPGLILKF